MADTKMAAKSFKIDPAYTGLKKRARSEKCVSSI